MLARAAIYLGLVLGITGLAGVARGARRDWTGTAACGTCHATELAAWQVTPHARTRDRFASRPDPRCLGCHATGEAPAGPAIAIEVGCEACHGAGAAYAADDVMRDRPVARALGLTDLSTPAARAAVCAPCHRRATRGTPFDPMAPVHPITPTSRPR
jgi:cytochrome c554/c'-like protein